MILFFNAMYGQCTDFIESLSTNVSYLHRAQCWPV